MLSDADVLALFDLAGVRSDDVQVRLPGDLAGPSASYAIVVRHPRFLAHSQVDWKDSDLQRHGWQATDELNYIMEPRPERGLYIFMNNHPSPSGKGSGSWRTSLRCKSFGMTSTVIL